MMQGQALPSLGKAKEISDGTLPNGISYYVVKNGHSKGFADFALVQHGVPDYQATRKALATSPHFLHRKPYEFLADHGVGYGPEGFASYDQESTRFDFRNVPTYDEAVADSTILMMFGIAESNPYRQALVVSGDVDPARIVERLKMLSLLLPARRNYPGDPYEWHQRDSMVFRVTENPTSDVAALHLIYSAERIPRENLDSAIPLVTRMYSHELGFILDKRLKAAFREADIPLADLRYRYLDSAQGPEDERYSITVYTSASHVVDAARTIASVLGSLDKEGAGAAEFQDAKDRLVSDALRQAEGGSRPNSEYVDQCVSAYLYGSHLASAATVNDFVVKRRLSEDREVELFNGFAQAVLDSTRNLTMRCDVPEGGPGRRAIIGAFCEGWGSAGGKAVSVKANYGDTLKLYRKFPKVKLSKETKDPVSGGQLWTFSNGVKVVYRKMSTGGGFHYSLMLRGGYADVPGLHRGEGAFVGDMLSCMDVEDFSGEDFSGMLLANGISMEGKVTLSDMRIGGMAPNNKMQLLLNALVSLATRRTPNMDVFDYYRRGEALRLDMEALSPRDVNSMMDNIISPDYYYPDRKEMSCLGDDLPERAEKYFARQFSKVNDGVLVIVGDLDPVELKKMLIRTVGGFSTMQKFAPRPDTGKEIILGSSTHFDESAPGLVGGGEIGVNIEAAARMSFNLANYMSFKVAVAALRKSLIGILASHGAYADLTEKFEMFPTEMLSIYVNCKPCYADGLPEGVYRAEPQTMLEDVRRAISDVNSTVITAAELKAYKADLLNMVESEMKLPQTVVDNVLVRYSEGKDIVNDYKAAVNGVTVQSVQKILQALASGAMVEYVII